MSRASSSEAGFLLADTLVTLTISAFVLVGLTSLSSVLLRVADRSVAAIQATDGLDRTVLSLSRLIREAARARFSGAEPQPFLFNGDDRRLMFARKASGSGRTQGLEVLAFRSDPDGRLMRASAPLPAAAGSPGDLPFGPAYATYAGPARFRFSFRAPSDAAGQSGWLAAWPIGMRMPEAVAIETVDASGRQVLARLEVRIMADTDLGCLSGRFCGRSAAPNDATSFGRSPTPAAVPANRRPGSAQ